MKHRFRLPLCLSAAMIFSVLISCSTVKPAEEKPVPEKDLITRIEKLISEGNIKGALDLYEAENGDDDLLYAILLFNNDRLDDAETVLSDFLVSDPQNEDALYYLSMIYNIKGDSAKEEEILKKILAVNPENENANLAIGKLYYSKKKYKQAEKAFKKGLEKGSLDNEARLGYAVLLMKQKKNDEALKQYDTVIKNDPENMFAYIDRGYLKSLEEDYEGAEKDLNEAVKLDPDYIWNYVDRGRTRLYSGKFEEAVSDFDKAIEMDPEMFICYAHRAKALEALGENDRALEDYKKALSRNGEYYYGYLPAAMQLFRAGEYKQAAEYFLKANEAEPNSTFVLLAAASLMKDGDKFNAKNLVKNELAKIPRDDLLYHVARVYIDPPYEGIAVRKVDEEKIPLTQMQGYFYTGLYYDTFGKSVLSQDFFSKVIDFGFTETLEHKIAEWKLAEK